MKKINNTLGDPRAVNVHFQIPQLFTTVTGQRVEIFAGNYDAVVEPENDETSTITFEDGSKITGVMNSVFAWGRK